MVLWAAAAALNFPGNVMYHRRVDVANEAANHAYAQCIYPGKIVLFWLRTHYTEFRDTLFEWDPIAQGGVEVHALLVLPRRMLVQHFVLVLAREIERVLRDIAATSDNPRDV